MLNRAKIFFHKLQCDCNLSWDQVMSKDLQDEWRRICKQANATPPVVVDRFIGAREGAYNLVAFCDASSVCYGVVVDIINVSNSNSYFLLAKKKIVM